MKPVRFLWSLLVLCLMIFLVFAPGVRTQQSLARKTETTRIVSRVSLIGETGSVPETTLFVPTEDHMHRISAYVISTGATTNVSCSNGASSEIAYLALLVRYSDDLTSRQTGAATLGWTTGSGDPGGENFPIELPLIRAKAGTPLTYELQYRVTPGCTVTPGVRYDFFQVVEEL